MFGNSPDETANSRLSLNRETVSEALVMIQPSLLSYGFPEEGYDLEGIPVDCPSQCHLLKGAAT